MMQLAEYTFSVLTVSDEQRHYLEVDGAPLPLIDPDNGQGYILMPVRFTRGPQGRIQARMPGIRAASEGEQATEALATLALLVRDVLDRL